jgi:hypothetical protein
VAEGIRHILAVRNYMYIRILVHPEKITGDER